jgi:hypothetical protein
MTPRITLLLSLACITVVVPHACGQPAAPPEAVAASFMLARGRAPTADEATAWAAGAERSVSALLARHRVLLRGDAAAQREVLARAWQDAFGVAAGTADLALTAAEPMLYSEALTRHLAGLAAHPEGYRQVIDRAYRGVLARPPYAIEIDYWTERSPLPCALLAAAIDDWARRNLPGLTATSGTPAVSVNSARLASVRVSAATAREIRDAAALRPAGDPAQAAALDRRVLAPGAGELTSVGGIHFVAAGAAPPAPSGGERRQR